MRTTRVWSSLRRRAVGAIFVRQLPSPPASRVRFGTHPARASYTVLTVPAGQFDKLAISLCIVPEHFFTSRVEDVPLADRSNPLKLTGGQRVVDRLGYLGGSGHRVDRGRAHRAREGRRASKATWSLFKKPTVDAGGVEGVLAPKLSRVLAALEWVPANDARVLLEAYA